MCAGKNRLYKSNITLYYHCDTVTELLYQVIYIETCMEADDPSVGSFINFYNENGKLRYIFNFRSIFPTGGDPRVFHRGDGTDRGGCSGFAGG